MANIEAKGGYDPFADNLLMPYALEDWQVLVHVLKASLGSGILAMPKAFSYAGLIFGFFGALLTGLTCGHCAYVLVQVAHRLYYSEQKSSMTYAEVADVSMNKGPVYMQRCAPIARITISVGLWLTYFGACTCYVVFVAVNMGKVLETWTGNEYNVRSLIACSLVPFLLLVYIPNLKILAPFSLVAILFLLSAVLISTYYFFEVIEPLDERKMMVWETLPGFFSITIFSVECIGIILPLVNNMKTPPHFLGICGVLTKGMIVVTLFVTLFGFFGYWRYGDLTEASISVNLPNEELPAQLVTLLIALAMIATYALAFTVCLEITWDLFKEQCNNSLLWNYVTRTVLAVSTISVAFAVPEIAPIVQLIGAFCFSILGLILPVVFEISLDLDSGFGPFLWVLWKDIFIIGFGIFALIFGTKDALIEFANAFAS